MVIWEYNVIRATGLIPLASLNDLGKKGWEMVSVSASGATLIIYLKRVKESV